MVSLSIRSRHAPFRRAGLVFTSAREPLVIEEEAGLTEGQLLRLAADPAISIAVVDREQESPMPDNMKLKAAEALAAIAAIAAIEDAEKAEALAASWDRPVVFADLVEAFERADEEGDAGDDDAKPARKPRGGKRGGAPTPAADAAQ